MNFGSPGARGIPHRQAALWWSQRGPAINQTNRQLRNSAPASACLRASPGAVPLPRPKCPPVTDRRPSSKPRQARAPWGCGVVGMSAWQKVGSLPNTPTSKGQGRIISPHDHVPSTGTWGRW